MSKIKRFVLKGELSIRQVRRMLDDMERAGVRRVCFEESSTRELEMRGERKEKKYTMYVTFAVDDGRWRYIFAAKDMEDVVKVVEAYTGFEGKRSRIRPLKGINRRRGFVEKYRHGRRTK